MARRTGLLLVVWMCSSMGCMPIPHPEAPMSLRPGVSGPSDWAFIEPGSTTREQVVLALGEPDFHWHNERVLAYRWVGTELLVVYAFGYGYSGAAGAFSIPKQHVLLIAFDDRGRVRKLEERHEAAFDWISMEKLRDTWEEP